MWRFRKKPEAKVEAGGWAPIQGQASRALDDWGEPIRCQGKNTA